MIYLLEANHFTFPDIFCSKTQIALEYAYLKRDDSAGLSVFWIHASNPSRIVESYKRIASECEIPGRNNPELDVLQLVRNWFETKYNCRWLMVIDNVDDRAMFFEEKISNGKAPCEYIPQSPKGSILYTTRNKDIGIDLASHRDPIIVPPMTVAEARSLLGEKVNAESTEGEQLELLDELVYLPLAITQAAAFMAKRHKNVSQYIELYRQSDSTSIRLLDQRFMYHGREARPPESVLTTWRISFHYIRTENPRAAELLSIMSFLDRQGIPSALLISEDEDPFDFDEAIGLLEAFSLVTRNTLGDACNIHRLVQIATRAWLSGFENKPDNIAARTLALLASRYPYGSDENWSTCAVYLPHAEAILRHNFADCIKANLIARATLLLNTSSYLRSQGRFDAAELEAEESMHIHKSLLGQEHPATLASIDNLAETFQESRRLKESVALRRLVLQEREKVFGSSDMDTLNALAALGYSLQLSGEYSEAERLHRRDLDERQKMLDHDPENPLAESGVLRAIDNLARVLFRQGKDAEAESMFRQVLERSESSFGQEHPDTVLTLGQLANTLVSQEKLEEAESIYQRLLQHYQKFLGELHPRTFAVLSNIATLRFMQGEYREAEQLNRRVIHYQKNIFGEENPHTLRTSYNLGSVLEAQGKYQEAEECFRRTFVAVEEILGPVHPFTLKVRRSLANSLRIQGKYEEAERMIRQELEIRSAVPGIEQSQIYHCLYILAGILQEQEKFGEAEQIYRQVLDFNSSTIGWERKDTYLCLLKLASVLQDQKKFGEAEGIYGQMVDLSSKLYGTDHAETLENLYRFARMLEKEKKYDQAEENYRRLLEAWSNVLGKEHLDTLRVTNLLGEVLSDQKKFEESEFFFRQAYTSYSRVFGSEDFRTLSSLYNLVFVLADQDEFDESESLIRQAYTSCSTVLGSEHPFTLESLHNLADVLANQEKFEESESLFRQAYTGYSKAMGSEHPYTLNSLRRLTDVLYESGKHQEAESLYQQLAETTKIPDTPVVEAKCSPTTDSEGMSDFSSRSHQSVASAKSGLDHLRSPEM